jgi:hypothetical protein
VPSKRCVSNVPCCAVFDVLLTGTQWRDSEATRREQKNKVILCSAVSALVNNTNFVACRCSFSCCAFTHRTLQALLTPLQSFVNPMKHRSSKFCNRHSNTHITCPYAHTHQCGDWFLALVGAHRRDGAHAHKRAQAGCHHQRDHTIVCAQNASG